MSPKLENRVLCSNSSKAKDRRTGTLALILEYLVVCDSRFENFHGLNACSNLLNLLCWNGTIAASDELHNLSVRNRGGIVVPGKLSGLTALSKLRVDHA